MEIIIIIKVRLILDHKPVREQVVVVPLGDGLLDLDSLALELGLADSEGVGGSAVPDSLPQPRLETFLGRVQIVVNNLTSVMIIAANDHYHDKPGSL